MKYKLNNRIKLAIAEGLEFRPNYENGYEVINSRLLPKLNEQLDTNFVAVKHIETGYHMIINADDAYMIHSNEYYAYRLQYQYVYDMASKRELNTWIKNEIGYAGRCK